MFYVLNFKTHTFVSCDTEVDVDHYFINETKNGETNFDMYEIVNAFDDGCRMSFEEFCAGIGDCVDDFVDLVLEIADLNKYENEGETIYIDKSIFDNYLRNAVLYIMFTENEDSVYEYVMTDETDTEIICQLMEIVPLEDFIEINIDRD